MVGEAREFWRLQDDDELERLVRLAREADRVQLKLAVEGSAYEATSTSLGIDLTLARSRRVYYLDTPDLALERHGVLVRVRSIERRPDDSVIKLRPVVPGELPARLRRSKRFVVELDAMPGGYVCSGALKARLGVHAVERALSGQRPLHALFSSRQLALLAASVPADVAIDDLAILGPIDVRRGKVVPSGLGRSMSVELWTYPDGSQILELSTRCSGNQVLRIASRTAAVLRARGVPLTEHQQPKARATLDFFTNGARGEPSR